MSWKENIKSPLVITCGDGKVYQPLSVLTDIENPYNVSIFNFIEQAGSLVVRQEPKGRQFPLNFYFQGDDNFDQSESFRISANDKRPWIVSHPVYGLIKCQPVSSLRQSPKSFNSTSFSVDMMETIDDIAPDIGKDPADFALRAINLANNDNINSLSNTNLSVSNTVTIGENMDNAYNIQSNLQINTDQSNEYLNLYNTSKSLLSSSISDAGLLSSALNAFLTYPATFETTVKSKLNALKSQYDILSNNIGDLITPEDKIVYENNANSIISSSLETSLNYQDGDYLNLPDVIFVIDTIIDLNNSFLNNLNIIQTDNGGLTTSYIPNYTSLNSLSNALFYTLSQLQVIALGAQQERKLVLNESSNPIVLSHRFYGSGENNIQRFLNENGIVLNNNLIIPVGTELVYYV